MSSPAPWALVALCVLTACQAPPTVEPSAEPAPFVVRRADFVRDIARSEGAAEAIKKAVGRPICAALSARDPRQIEALLDPGFSGRAWGPWGTPAGEPAVTKAAPDPRALTGAAWAAGWVKHVEAYAALTRCAIAPVKFELDPDGRGAFVVFDVTLAGRGDGVALTDAATLSANVADRGEWRLVRAELGPVQRVANGARPMTEVSAQVGISMRRTADAEAAVQHLLDGRQTETIGGLAVVDVDRDDRPDVLAWNARRALHLFRNDGKDGFELHPSLLPAEAVGMFQLLVDLDGDGVDELISSAAECAEGSPVFPLYRFVESRLVRVGGLPFDYPCDRLDRYDVQHLTVADVDGDGRLDVFASVYRTSPPDVAINQFDSNAGGANRLFLNRGALRFEEVAASAGIDGTRFSYGAVFFDVDRDGDEDLYVVNDYGPNDLLLNDGRGRFGRAPPSPLTENGQSMGVTVGDFDGDLALDLYVSNMYSKAGQRIAPLAADRLSPQSAKELAQLAGGNTLYRQTAPGQYAEVGHALGVYKALWAWGQAGFDVDNDGDRDLYVVNGMTSHSRIREHDF